MHNDMGGMEKCLDVKFGMALNMLIKGRCEDDAGEFATNATTVPD